jgi:hypothetical protein
MPLVGNQRGFSRCLKKAAAVLLGPAEPVVQFFIGGGGEIITCSSCPDYALATMITAAPRSTTIIIDLRILRTALDSRYNPATFR